MAPGVGDATDMFIIGLELGSLRFVETPHLTELESIYQEEQAKILEVTAQSMVKVNQYVDEIARTTTPQEQTTSQPDS